MLCVGVEQPPDHALVLSVMFPGLALEELDASLAQCAGDHDAFIPKDEFLQPRKKSPAFPSVTASRRDPKLGVLIDACSRLQDISSTEGMFPLQA